MASCSYNTRCIVLSKTKLKETDAILTMIADDGHQVRAVAKGLRRPGSRIGARLEPYSEVDLLLHAGRSLDIVREVRTVNTNAACREGLDKASACALIAEFVSKVTREADVEPRLYQMTSAAFGVIGASEPHAAGLVAAAHLLKSFASLGVRPALRECALCGEGLGPRPVFDLSAGGALCDSCAGQAPGSGADDSLLIAWADSVLHRTFADLAADRDAPVRMLLDLCESWSAEHLSVKMRSFGFLKSLY